MTPDPPTVVVVNDFAYVEGGASQVALRSAVGLAERGNSVHLLAAVGPAADFVAASKVRLTLLDQFSIADDPNRFRAAFSGVWNRKAYRATRGLLNNLRGQPLVVHAHVWVKSLSSSVIRAAFDARVPVVVTAHDYFTACPNGGFYNYRTGEICPLRAMSPICVVTNCDKRSYAQKVWRVARQAVQRGRGGVPGRLTDVITVSDLSESILKPYLPSGATLHRVANPVFVEKAPPVDPGSVGAFVVVGRLDPEKGPLLAAQAFAATGVEGVFVGDGPCAGEVRRLASRAVVTGWLKRDDVLARLSAARALVFPSRWYETMGLVVAEAAALGVPSIVADSSAAAELVEHDRTGLLFRSGDQDGLCQAINTLSDPVTARRLGAAAYEKYWANPATLENHLDRLELVYRRALGRS
jgi:glycosyltransferase involved in cell wall biosynthesis